MKIFILIEDIDYEPFVIIGVYADEEKARNKMIELIAADTKKTDDTFDHPGVDDVMKGVYEDYPEIFYNKYKILEYEVIQ